MQLNPNVGDIETLSCAHRIVVLNGATTSGCPLKAAECARSMTAVDSCRNNRAGLVLDHAGVTNAAVEAVFEFALVMRPNVRSARSRVAASV